MFSQNFYLTYTSLMVYYLLIPLTLSSQLSIANQGHNIEVSELLDFIKLEFGKQNHRIELLEVHNRNQDEEIDQDFDQYLHEGQAVQDMWHLFCGPGHRRLGYPVHHHQGQVILITITINACSPSRWPKGRL